MIPLDTVSIVVPCYNNADTIIETLDSICNQNYNSIEIIIVNDGSTDHSKTIIEEFIDSNKNIKIQLLNQTNQGPSKTRNNGAAQALGNFLVFIDADDLIAPTYISECIKVYKKNTKANIVYSDVALFGAASGKWELREFCLPNFLYDNCIPIFAMIKTEVFKKVGGFDENLSFNEDWELWIRIVKEFGGVERIPLTLFYYRKRLDNSSLTDNRNNNNTAENARLYIYNKHYEYYREFDLDLFKVFSRLDKLEKIKKKYYGIWYKKLFYSILKNKK